MVHGWNPKYRTTVIILLINWLIDEHIQNAVFVSRTNNHSDDFVVPSLVTRLPGTSGRSTGRFRSARTSLAWLLLLLFCKKKRRSRTTPSVVPSKFGDKAERRSYFDRSKLIHPSPLSRTTSGVRAPPARAPPPIHDVYDFSDVIGYYYYMKLWRTQWRRRGGVARLTLTYCLKLVCILRYLC